MDFSKLRECMDMLVNEYHTPGVDCIVYQEHEEIFRYYTGMSDIENHKKVNGHELYIIFSMTKMLTCACALQLFEQGKFRMDDPLCMYLDEFRNMRITNDVLNTENAAAIANGSMSGENENHVSSGYAIHPITIRDLFTMSAGLDYNLSTPEIKERISQGRTSTRDVVGALSKTVLGFEPGTRFRYSLCHDVLGALIEVWSGMKFGEYMKKYLLEPLGMNRTFFGVPKDEETLSQMAARYIIDKDKNVIRMPLECPFNFTEEYESGGAGLVSCTEDYALFLDALANGGVGKSGKRILSPSSVELMRTNHLKGKQLEDFDLLRKGYGYGLGVRTHLDPSRSGSISPIGEFGWDGAAGGFSMVDVKNKISLTYFQQMHNWDVGIQNKIRNALYSALKEKG